jgi:septin family protein
MGVEIIEDGHELSINVIDTPGFGMECDPNATLAPLIEYIDTQFYNYAARDKEAPDDEDDDLVHCLLYFIAPDGRTHSLYLWNDRVVDSNGRISTCCGY